MVGISDNINNIKSSFCFRGNIKSKDDLPLDANIGDIYISNNNDDDDDIWVCTTTTNKWDIISSPFNYLSANKHITYPTNCKNCGAILHNHICEYCGSDNKE